MWSTCNIFENRPSVKNLKYDEQIYKADCEIFEANFQKLQNEKEKSSAKK